MSIRPRQDVPDRLTPVIWDYIYYNMLYVIGANRGVRNTFPVGVGKRRHGQGGGRRDERMGVREAQHGELFIGERR